MPPCSKNSAVFLLDPMLATGGSSAAAAKIAKAHGAGKIVFISLIGTSQGIDKLTKDCPDMPVYLAAIDEKLTANGYIIPGLGDAGDRAFF